MDQPVTGRLNIRTRIALAVIVLVGLALGLVGLTLFTVQRAATEAQAIGELSRGHRRVRNPGPRGRRSEHR